MHVTIYELGSNERKAKILQAECKVDQNETTGCTLRTHLLTLKSGMGMNFQQSLRILKCRKFLEEIGAGKHNHIVNAEHPRSNTLGTRLRYEAIQRRSQPEKYGKHKLPRENKCDICGESFSRSSNLRRHANVHTDSKNHKCEFCDKSFKYSTSLNCHKKVAHSSEQASGEDQVNICDVCGKRAASSWHLTSHMRVHSKEKPFLCDLCGRPFVTSSNFYRHCRTAHPQMTRDA
ncbi:zinc finger protein 90 [Clonorchis sinensis]|uniref:Zinc finger protein 865 n=1 Tax=Clonorchis sinensis TaxID=79923 RepID=G7YDU9_CLOSI|nr:zinc finger protein 90 [Clonorchis sinensis]